MTSVVAQIGEEIKHEDQVCIVQRIVHSTTLFEEGSECYLLEEQYAQVQTEMGGIKFITFSAIKHPFVKKSKLKGLSPSVWKKF